MGNRALRQQVAARLKQMGAGFKLYRGKGWRYPPADQMRHFLLVTDLKIGDVIRDCDLHNHRIAKLPKPKRFANYVSGYQVVMPNSFDFQDGGVYCGCTDPRPPRSREAIEADWLAWYRWPGSKGWLNDLDHARYQQLQSGGHIHDQDGVLLPQFR